MQREVEVAPPQWGPWPSTVWVPERQALRTRGVLEPPGAFVYETFVYIVLVFALMWAAVGSPAVVAGRWIAIAFNLAGDKTPGWVAAAIIVGAVPVYRAVWFPLMLRLFGGRFDVWVSDQEVTVQRGRGTVSVPRVEIQQLGMEDHTAAQALQRGAGSGPFAGMYRNTYQVAMWWGQLRIVIVPVTAAEHDRGQALALRLSTIVQDFSSIAVSLGARVRRGAATAEPDDEGGYTE